MATSRRVSRLLRRPTLRPGASQPVRAVSHQDQVARRGHGTLRWVASICFALALYSNRRLLNGQLRSATSFPFYAYDSLPVSSSTISSSLNTESVKVRNGATPRARSVSVPPSHVNTTANVVRNIWEDSSVLPQWMKDYFSWHKEQTTHNLNETSWKSYRYLVARCLRNEKCGGASDRLQSVPMLIRVASMTNRILLIKWTRPTALEEYLMPPANGINWTVPVWLDQRWRADTAPTLKQYPGLAASVDYRIVATRDQTHDHGMNFYNKHLKIEDNEAHFGLVFRDVWNVLFTPSPPVAALVEQNLQKMNLVPGHYVAVHIRSKYKSDESNNRDLIRNSLNCASNLRQEHARWPMYLASDSTNTTKRALAYALYRNFSSLVYRDSNSTDDPLCLDKTDRKGYQFDKPELFYDLFVDLYLLANSACSTHGIGGYGIWGTRLSYNSTCRLRHSTTRCAWTDAIVAGTM